MRKNFSVVMILLCVVLSLGPLALSQDLRENEQAQEQTTSVESALRTAASQYEIIGVLLAEERYAETVAEFAVIVNLRLEGNQEVLVARAAWDFAVILREAGEYTVAHEFIDQALEVAVGAESRYSLLMMRGKIYKDQKNYSMAIKALREAQQLGIVVVPPDDSSQKTRVPN